MLVVEPRLPCPRRSLPYLEARDGTVTGGFDSRLRRSLAFSELEAYMMLRTGGGCSIHIRAVGPRLSCSPGVPSNLPRGSARSLRPTGARKEQGTQLLLAALPERRDRVDGRATGCAFDDAVSQETLRRGGGLGDAVRGPIKLRRRWSLRLRRCRIPSIDGASLWGHARLTPRAEPGWRSAETGLSPGQWASDEAVDAAPAPRGKRPAILGADLVGESCRGRPQAR